MVAKSVEAKVAQARTTQRQAQMANAMAQRQAQMAKAMAKVRSSQGGTTRHSKWLTRLGAKICRATKKGEESVKKATDIDKGKSQKWTESDEAPRHSKWLDGLKHKATSTDDDLAALHNSKAVSYQYRRRALLPMAEPLLAGSQPTNHTGDHFSAVHFQRHLGQ